MEQVIYNGDKRYPGPKPHSAPSFIKGIPTQQELDAFPRMFTWGELKEIVQTGDLERLMRNKAMQARYDEWMNGIKVRYGSTETYLTQARLPWTDNPLDPGEPAATYDISTSPSLPTSATLLAAPNGLTPSTNPVPPPAPAPNGSSQPTTGGSIGRGSAPHKGIGTGLHIDVEGASAIATPGGGRSGLDSGAATPSSAGFVSMANLRLVNGKLKASGSKSKSKNGSKSGTGSSTPLSPRVRGEVGQNGEMEGQQTDGDDEADDGGEEEEAVFLKWDPEKGLEKDKYAVLPNDWPYNVPYGVRHYCVWSRVPIAHPELVEYDAEAWSRIENEGMGGFTGITPLRPFHITSPPQSPLCRTPPHGTIDGLSTSPLDVKMLFTQDMVKKEKRIGKLDDRSWYAADVAYAGGEMRQWAGVEYESKGGKEVGGMVKGLWDPKGWECLWFVNPPRLQSVPGFSHFHVFARRKTPEEIDASEAV